MVSCVARASSIAALALLLASSTASAQAVSGRVVENASGQRVPTVQLWLVTPSGSVVATTTSDTAGYFRIATMPGTYHLRTARLGYAPTSDSVSVRGVAETVTVIVRLVPQGIPLPALEVTARGGPERGRDGFERRLIVGKGFFLNLDSIRGRHPRVVTDVFNGIPQVFVWDVPGQAASISSMTRSGCLMIFMDNHPAPLYTSTQRDHDPTRRGRAYVRSDGDESRTDINTYLSVRRLRAVEIYRDISEVPAELMTNARLRTLKPWGASEPCGMVWLWTEKGW